MIDGTYYINPLTEEIIDYGAKWQYGYFVGTIPAFIIDPNQERESNLWDNILDAYYVTGSPMIGVWTNPETGFIFFDAATHVSDRNSAKYEAEKHNQEYVFDAFLQKSVKVSEL
jgi:hypothetical protein